MAKTPTKTTAPAADTKDTGENPRATALENTLVKPDPDAEPTAPATVTADKDATKEQFAAADAVAARAISGL